MLGERWHGTCPRRVDTPPTHHQLSSAVHPAMVSVLAVIVLQRKPVPEMWVLPRWILAWLVPHRAEKGRNKTVTSFLFIFSHNGVGLHPAPVPPPLCMHLLRITSWRFLLDISMSGGFLSWFLRGVTLKVLQPALIFPGCFFLCECVHFGRHLR